DPLRRLDGGLERGRRGRPLAEPGTGLAERQPEVDPVEDGRGGRKGVEGARQPARRPRPVAGGRGDPAEQPAGGGLARTVPGSAPPQRLLRVPLGGGKPLPVTGRTRPFRV